MIRSAGRFRGTAVGELQKIAEEPEVGTRDSGLRASTQRVRSQKMLPASEQGRDG